MKISPIIPHLLIADANFIEELKEFDEEILNILYFASNDTIQKLLIEELCRIKNFQLIPPTIVA